MGNHAAKQSKPEISSSDDPFSLISDGHGGVRVNANVSPEIESYLLSQHRIARLEVEIAAAKASNKVEKIPLLELHLRLALQDFRSAEHMIAHKSTFRFRSVQLTPLEKVEDFRSRLHEELLVRRGEFGKLIVTLVGTNFQSFEQNRHLADMIHETAALVRAAFKCPKCGDPARLKCVQSGRNRNGVFSFAHGSGVTHGGTTTLPLLELTEPEEDKRKKRENTIDKESENSV